jgi:hypothetical protein
MATDKQIEANRRNAKHSKGPTTDEGKRKSSRNALKHGLTAKDLLLPQENPQEFQERLEHWQGFYGSDDPGQEALVRRAVVDSWRLDRCVRHETATLAERVHHAVMDFDNKREARAEELGQRLIFEPIGRMAPAQVHDPVVRARLERRQADHPITLVRELETTLQGANWLLRRWEELCDAMRFRGYWHYTEKFKAIQLMGKRPEDLFEDFTLQELFAACHKAHPEPISMNDESFQAVLGCTGKVPYWLHVQHMEKALPKTLEEAQRAICNIMDREMDRLEALRDNALTPLNAMDRAGAINRASFDPSPAGALLRRYESACERDFHKSLADLRKNRPEMAPEVPSDAPPEEAVSRNEPIAEVIENTGVTATPVMAEVVVDRVSEAEMPSGRLAAAVPPAAPPKERLVASV